MKKHIIKLEEDVNGDLILPLPEDICNELNLKENDIINWIDNKDGTYTIKKKESDLN